MYYIVSGRVQGVWYRGAAQDKARALNVTGWIKNRQNNDVEVLACGEQEKLDQFEKWLWQGPKLAKVNSVINDELPWQEHDDFVIGY